MNKVWKGVIAAIAITFTAGATADTPVQFSTINNFNAPADDTVIGVRFPALYGKTGTVKGVDLHLLAIGETDTFVGVQFPLIFVGANHINTSMTGVSIGVWNWNKGQTTGVNWGAVNITNNVKGANIGFVNYSIGDTIFDWSAANISKSSTVQIGIFNMTDEIRGVQIGLINCAKNGFLPCFILFNFGTK